MKAGCAESYTEQSESDCDCAIVQDHGLETGLDMALIPRCAPALPFGNAKPVPVYIEERALNTHRAIGTTLSHEVLLLSLLTRSSAGGAVGALTLSHLISEEVCTRGLSRAGSSWVDDCTCKEGFPD